MIAPFSAGPADGGRQPHRVAVSAAVFIAYTMCVSTGSKAIKVIVH